jgi:hypothetical protein
MTQQDKINLIFSALERGEVSITHFAKLTRVSRVSLHAWKKGAHINDQLRLNLSVNVAKRIQKAVGQGLLPLKDDLKSGEKLAATMRIIREVG